MFDFPKQKYFDEKALGKKSNRKKSLIRLLYSPAVSSTKILPENPDELCDRLKV